MQSKASPGRDQKTLTAHDWLPRSYFVIKRKTLAIDLKSRYFRDAPTTMPKAITKIPRWAGRLWVSQKR